MCRDTSSARCARALGHHSKRISGVGNRPSCTARCITSGAVTCSAGLNSAETSSNGRTHPYTLAIVNNVPRRTVVLLSDLNERHWVITAASPGNFNRALLLQSSHNL